MSGLWHGASWTFVVWGVLNGMYVIAGRLTRPFRDRLWRNLNWSSGVVRLVLQIVITFSLVNLGWVFFRADTFQEALFILRSIGESLLSGSFWVDLSNVRAVVETLGLARESFIALGTAILVLAAVDLAGELKWGTMTFGRLPLWLRWPVYYAVMLYIVWFGFFGEQAFIYFQF